MTSEIKLLVMLIYVSFVLSMQHCSARGEPEVPCFFIFGDSLVDNGNNNLLSTSSKANYPPYGIDFPIGETGRFCNGRTTADILSELMGFEDYILPFSFANGSSILQGVNYASGGAGIRSETGVQLGTVISMDEQLINHNTTISRIIALIGEKKLAKDHLNKCLYSVGMGSNDYMNNYFSQYYNTSQEYTVEEYAQVLVQQYSQQLLRLYEHGAKKVVVNGVGLIGCTPGAISSYDTNGSSCVDELNIAAQLFNQQLVSLVDDLNTNLTDAKFIYINSYEIGSGVLADPGFTVSDVGCCEVNGYGLCILDQTPCQNRTEYVFWDSLHPTEAFNVIAANRIYRAQDPADAYPMDVSHLVELEFNPLVAEM